ncbi:MAG TPA: hypothetical protein VMU16_06560 [Candidatus Binataceae bacterium]|nr:hypothetical protein [Candidatus Binataceae bacterium]
MARVTLSVLMLGATFLSSCAATQPSASSPASSPPVAVATPGERWYLMLPPPMMPPTQDEHGNFRVDTSAPISRWLIFKALPTKDQCEAQLKGMADYCRCYSSTTPALKGMPPPSP